MTRWSWELEDLVFWGPNQNKALLASGICDVCRGFSKIVRWCRLMRLNSEKPYFWYFWVYSGAILTDFTKFRRIRAKSKSLNIDEAVVIGTERFSDLGTKLKQNFANKPNLRFTLRLL